LPGLGMEPGIFSFIFASLFRLAWGFTIYVVKMLTFWRSASWKSTKERDTLRLCTYVCAYACTYVCTHRLQRQRRQTVTFLYKNIICQQSIGQFRFLQTKLTTIRHRRLLISSHFFIENDRCAKTQRKSIWIFSKKWPIFVTVPHRCACF
jgi:hypothetical protein